MQTVDMKNFNFIRELEKLPTVEKIWLYGSRARGDSKERSDIDLAIECPWATRGEWFKLMDVIDNADTLLKIDCVRLDELENDSSFKQNIINERELLFQKSEKQMMEIKWKKNFTDLGNALDRFEDSLELAPNDNRIIMDGTIHRFEFCIELMWLNFKYFLEKEGKEALSPKQAISLAYQMKWFDNEELWLAMLSDRNKTSHTYKQDKAHEVYANLKLYYPEMRAVYDKLRAIMNF